jgi:hypothetical protein
VGSTTTNCNAQASAAACTCGDNYVRATITVSFTGLTSASITDAGVQAELQGAIADALSVPVSSVFNCAATHGC